ncbi:MAG: class I SAM-dependent methyltransferase [Deltaproteobacteria bacterium]|nr:class I SAM-dependent methyltransferase [Deltaproteobacteria bacterium]
MGHQQKKLLNAKDNILYRPALMAQIYSTGTYHRTVPIDLMKEFTICESFSRANTEYCVALERPAAYGSIIGDFLIRQGLLRQGASIVEIGGGYGSLMNAFLSAHAEMVKRVVMVDLSEGLLRRQKKTLERWHDKVRFVRADIHELAGSIRGADLIIMNEVIGDLDTMIDIDPEDLPHQVRRLVDSYGLGIPSQGCFNLNIGAIKLIETICSKGIPIFLTEHSSDPIIPQDMDFLSKGLDLDSYPRRIDLFKHCEYTIRFSHLIQAAHALGRKTETGALLDLINIRKSPALNMIFTSRACSTDYQEIMFELLDHIREYRWLLIN